MNHHAHTAAAAATILATALALPCTADAPPAATRATLVSGDHAALFQPSSSSRSNSQATETHLYDMRDLLTTMPDHLLFEQLLDNAAQGKLSIKQMTPGLVMAQGPADAFHAFETITDRASATALERDTVEISLLLVPTADTPRVGSEPPEGAEPLAIAASTIRRGKHAQVLAIEEEAFIQRWAPVVADSSVGYEASIATVERGFRAQVAVAETHDETGSKLLMHIRGQALDAEVRTIEHDIDGAMLTTGLPTTRTRSFDSTLTLQPEQTTVIATASGFNADTTLIITARITPRNTDN